MKRASKRIILTSERVNNYGFRVLTDGIDLSQFERNPIMLWMHVRPFGSTEDQILALGNVIELKREVDPELGKVITGLPVFDETDKFAMRIYEKYENGTYRMASSGLRPKEWSLEPEHILPGQTGGTLVRSLMEELSLVDLGGNDDALTVALYDDSGAQIQLSLNGDNAAIPALNNPFTDMSKIELSFAKLALMLGKKEIATADQAESNILEVVQLANSRQTQIETLTREKSELQKKIDDADKIQLAADTKTMLDAAETDRKITADEKPFFEGQIVDRDSFEKVKLFLDKKGGAPTVQQALSGGQQGKVSLYAGKTWADLEKVEGALVKLKSEDINLFKELFKAQYNTDYQG